MSYIKFKGLCINAYIDIDKCKIELHFFGCFTQYYGFDDIEGFVKFGISGLKSYIHNRFRDSKQLKDRLEIVEIQGSDLGDLMDKYKKVSKWLISLIDNEKFQNTNFLELDFTDGENFYNQKYEVDKSIGSIKSHNNHMYSVRYVKDIPTTCFSNTASKEIFRSFNHSVHIKLNPSLGDFDKYNMHNLLKNMPYQTNPIDLTNHIKSLEFLESEMLVQTCCNITAMEAFKIMYEETCKGIVKGLESVAETSKDTKGDAVSVTLKEGSPVYKRVIDYAEDTKDGFRESLTLEDDFYNIKIHPEGCGFSICANGLNLYKKVGLNQLWCLNDTMHELDKETDVLRIEFGTSSFDPSVEKYGVYCANSYKTVSAIAKFIKMLNKALYGIEFPTYKHNLFSDDPTRELDCPVTIRSLGTSILVSSNRDVNCYLSYFLVHERWVGIVNSITVFEKSMIISCTKKHRGDLLLRDISRLLDSWRYVKPT